MTRVIVRAFVAAMVMFGISAGCAEAGWSSADIGSVGATGSASGSYTINGAGADVWGYSDAFHFVYTTLTGDGTIVTQVTSEEYVSNWTKAGVMMRETLSAGSRHAFMLVSPGKGLAFQRRLSTGGVSTHTSGGAGTAPYWVKLKRSGSTFTAYESADGVNWTTVGSDTITMASTIYVGVAVTSHDYGVLATANFASTAVTPSSTATATSTSTSSTTSSTLKFLEWNTHHGGIRTDGVYDPTLIAQWIAKINPQVVSLEEVDTTDDVSNIVNPLNSLTGVKWTVAFSGKGNLLLSRIGGANINNCLYDPSIPANAPHMTVSVNGRSISLFSAQMNVYSASSRATEIATEQSCASTWPQAWVMAGDYNMQYGSTEYYVAAKNYTDAWPAATALGTATNYPDNCDGCTRNSRIDYQFLSNYATFMKVKSAQIFDTRDANGVMPSDHKPFLVTYTVN